MSIESSIPFMQLRRITGDGNKVGYSTYLYQHPPLWSLSQTPIFKVIIYHFPIRLNIRLQPVFATSGFFGLDEACSYRGNDFDSCIFLALTIRWRRFLAWGLGPGLPKLSNPGMPFFLYASIQLLTASKLTPSRFAIRYCVNPLRCHAMACLRRLASISRSTCFLGDDEIGLSLMFLWYRNTIDTQAN